MNQRQKIGSSSQQQGLPDNKNPHIKPVPEKMRPVNQQPEKPAITDDAGNPVDKKNEDAGKGYNEKKQTEPGSYAIPEIETAKAPPPNNPKNGGKRYTGKKN